jgi:hypothetical protein
MVQNMEQDKGTAAPHPSPPPPPLNRNSHTPGALVTSRNIALADLLHHCSHHATAMRADAMRGILEIIQARDTFPLQPILLF